jgi:hypothetical protein
MPLVFKAALGPFEVLVGLVIHGNGHFKNQQLAFVNFPLVNRAGYFLRQGLRPPVKKQLVPYQVVEQQAKQQYGNCFFQGSGETKGDGNCFKCRNKNTPSKKNLIFYSGTGAVANTARAGICLYGYFGANRYIHKPLRIFPVRYLATTVLIPHRARMFQTDLKLDADYQEELIRYQQLYREVMDLAGAAKADGLVVSKTLDLQMVRLQLAELRWQVKAMIQSPLQLAEARDKTNVCLRHSLALIEDTTHANKVFLEQIVRTRATIAESQRLLNSLTPQE